MFEAPPIPPAKEDVHVFVRPLWYNPAMSIIILLESTRGEAYVEKFIRSLDPPTIAKVLRTLDLLEKHGSDLGMPHSKSLGKGLFELRVRGTMEIRIFYAFAKNDIYLLHAFQKKSQQTPVKEIDLARARLDSI